MTSLFVPGAADFQMTAGSNIEAEAIIEDSVPTPKVKETAVGEPSDVAITAAPISDAVEEPVEVGQVLPQALANDQPAIPITSTEPQSEVTPEIKMANSELAPTGWPQLDESHPISKFREILPAILERTAYAEVYGLQLSVELEHTFHTNLILQKFLRANSNNLEKAKSQLEDTLIWRRDFQPLECAKATYSQEKFGSLGYVAKLHNATEKQVVTFNIYGAVKDRPKTFGDVDGFLKWRVALMEKSIQALELDKATTPIPDFGTGIDSYRGIQVHDYATLSIIRQDPYVKIASKRVIDVMVKYYPETLSQKYFVNIPAPAVWVYTAMTWFLPKTITSKFVLCSSGKELVSHMKGFVEELPAAYGGTNRGSLDIIGSQLNLEVTEPELDQKTSLEAPTSEKKDVETTKEADEQAANLIPQPDSPSSTKALEAGVGNLAIGDTVTATTELSTSADKAIEAGVGSLPTEETGIVTTEGATQPALEQIKGITAV